MHFSALLVAFSLLFPFRPSSTEAPALPIPRPAESSGQESERSPQEWLAQAEASLDAGLHASAGNFYIEALAAALRTGDHVSATAAHDGLCQVEISFASVAHCWTALEGAQSRHDALAEVKIRLHLGEALTRIGQYFAATEELSRVQELAHLTGQVGLAVEGQEALGEAFIGQGRLEVGREALKQVLEYWRLNGDALREAGIHLRLAEIESALGRFRAAEPHLESALSIYQAAGQSVRTEEVLDGMTSRAAKLRLEPMELMMPLSIQVEPPQGPETAPFGEARTGERRVGPFRPPRVPLDEAFHDKLKRIGKLTFSQFELMPDDGLEAIGFRDGFELLEAQQQWLVLRLAKLDEASGLALLRGTDKRAVCLKFQLSEIESARAGLFRHLREPTRRQAALVSAWKTWEETSGVVLDAQFEAVRGAFSRSQKPDLFGDSLHMLFPSRQSYQRDLLLQSGIGPPLSIARTLCGLRTNWRHDRWLRAESERLAGKMGQAQHELTDLLQNSDLEPKLLAAVLLSRAQTNLALGNQQAALADYHRALEGIEWLQGDLSQQSIEFASLHADLYAELVRFHIDRGDAAEAFSIAERSRAYDFHRHLLATKGLARVASSKDLTQLRRIERLIQQIEPQHQWISKGGVDNEPFRRLDRRLTELRQEWQSVRSRLQPSAALGYETATLLQAQQSIADGSASLIAYYVTEAETFAWVIDGTSADMVRLPVGREALAQKVETFRQWIGDRGAARVRSPDLDRATAGWFFDQLVAPLAHHVRFRDVVLVPHGPLQYVPFAALWDGERYLNERWDTSIAPSATALRSLLGNRSTFNGKALVLGDPDGTLPAAAVEAREVAALLGTKPLLGKEATRQQLETQVSTADLLHIAAHGYFDSADAIASHLQLAPTGGPGKLSVADVSKLDLREVDLAVLSACETSVGQLSDGDDVVGLTRAFLSSGARSLITTLWAIDDEASAAVMTAFYRYLQVPGTNLAAALRAAQREVAQKERWQAPFYWAGFVLHGERRPLL